MNKTFSKNSKLILFSIFFVLFIEFIWFLLKIIKRPIFFLFVIVGGILNAILFPIIIELLDRWGEEE